MLKLTFLKFFCLKKRQIFPSLSFLFVAMKQVNYTTWTSNTLCKIFIDISIESDRFFIFFRNAAWFLIKVHVLGMWIYHEENIIHKRIPCTLMKRKKSKVWSVLTFGNLAPIIYCWWVYFEAITTKESG